MKPKLIKRHQDHEAALDRIEAIFDARPGTPEGDELELLLTLVDLYEDKVFPIDLPSPIDAIKFRMTQQNLKAKDLIPFIGSAPKVSEVLAGKRTLSLTMIRKLVNRLGIPAEVLLQQPGAALHSEAALEQGRHFPLAEMISRGWFKGFKGNLATARAQLDDLLSAFAGPLGTNALVPALNRQHIRLGSKPDPYALTAWGIRVIGLAMRETLPSYKTKTITHEFLRELSRLSYLDHGPLLAKEYLNKNGIHLICEAHLPGTHLDGAAMRLSDRSPLVALTLRHDRLDNFWFTLFHELAHISLHLDKDDVEGFYDDITDMSKRDKCEKEADEMAAKGLIPTSEWNAARLKRNSRTADVIAFAERLRISSSIPAGRIRYESKDFAVFRPLLGSNKVRAMFASTQK